MQGNFCFNQGHNWGDQRAQAIEGSYNKAARNRYGILFLQKYGLAGLTP